MTIVRNEQEALPRPAQLWASRADGMYPFLSRRFTAVCLTVALVPVIVVASFFWPFWEAYSGGAEAWGWPVVAMGDAPRAWVSIGYEPVGVVAIGLKAVGVIAIGNVAVGVVAIGPVAAVGAVSISVMSLGLWSLGVVSLGYASNGVLSAGRFAHGVIPVGWYACGKLAFGVYAWGLYVARGFKRAQIIRASKPPPPQGTEKLLFPSWRKSEPVT